MIDFMTSFRAMGCPVTLVCFSGSRWQPYAADFERIGIEVFTPAIGEDGDAYALGRLEDLSRERPGLYDLVIVPWPELFERTSPHLRRLFPSALLVYDCIDLHHIRLDQQRIVRSDVTDADVAITRERELTAVRSADVTLTVSAAERELLLALVPGATVQTLPLVYETVDLHGPADRADILFVGGFQHPPNVDGVKWFVDEVLPLIRPRRRAKLIVVGGDAPPEVVGLEGEDVMVVGHVPDVDAWYDRARVFVSPLRFGAGVKGKNVHALARGLPLVTTAVGIQGTAIRDGDEALVRNDPQGFAAGVVSLLDDDDLWLRVASKQVALAGRDHSPALLPQLLQPLLDVALRHSRADRDAATA
jgi:glycosyltransferase involved in cell wall biosynthesis